MLADRDVHCRFAIDDLLHHFGNWRSVTGIQRVAVEIVREALHLEPGRTSLVKASRLGGRFEPVTAMPSALAAALALPDKMDRGATEPRCGDYLVELGWAWPHWSFRRAALKARKQGLKLAIMVHDIIPITHPALFEAAHARRFVRSLERLSDQIDLFLVSSNSVKSQLREYLQNRGLSESRVECLPFGAGFRFDAEDERSLPWQAPFVLTVGTLEIRKNHLLLLKIWERLLARHGGDAVPTLVLIGRKGWKADQLHRELQRTGNLGGKIVWRQHVDDALLATAYRTCLFTVYPSLAEGWGLPVSESLRFGKLCVCSNRPALPEVGGPFADYFDPDNLDDAYRAVERPLLDADYLARRSREIATNYQVATWTETARRLLSVLR